jgi:hypothetical protein
MQRMESESENEIKKNGLTGTGTTFSTTPNIEPEKLQLKEDVPVMEKTLPSSNFKKPLKNIRKKGNESSDDASGTRGFNNLCSLKKLRNLDAMSLFCDENIGNPFFARSEMELNCYEIRNAINTLKRMCAARKYTDIQVDSGTWTITAMCGEKHVFVKVFDAVFRVQLGNKVLLHLPHPIASYESIIFVTNKFSSAFQRSFWNNPVYEFFELKEVQSDITKHELQPIRFEKITKDGFFINVEDLPKLSVSDPICRFYKFPLDSIIEITQYFDGRECKYYRIVKQHHKTGTIKQPASETRAPSEIRKEEDCDTSRNKTFSETPIGSSKVPVTIADVVSERPQTGGQQIN